MTENLEQGLVLMAAGMGTVFIFLLVMVWVMNLTAIIFKNKTPEAALAATSTGGASSNGNQAEIAAAVAAVKRIVG